MASAVYYYSIPGLALVKLSTSPESDDEASSLPWMVIAFCTADSIPSAIFIAVSKVRTGSESTHVDGIECVSHLLHTSRNVTSRGVPKLQNSAKALNSDIMSRWTRPAAWTHWKIYVIARSQTVLDCGASSLPPLSQYMTCPPTFWCY